MKSKETITIEDCSNFYSVEVAFIRELDNHGLIELTHSKESYTIGHDQLSLLEKYMHLHYDLDVNLEGIEVISHLLQKIDRLQTEVRRFKN